MLAYTAGTLSLADVALLWLIRTVLTVRVDVDGATAITHLSNELNNKTFIKLILDSRFNGKNIKRAHFSSFSLSLSLSPPPILTMPHVHCCHRHTMIFVIVLLF